MAPEVTGKDAQLKFWLQLDPALQRLVTAGDPLHEAVRNLLVHALSGLMETLGIPGKPVVKITALERTLSGGRFMRVAVEDQILRYADETLQLVYACVNGSIYRADVTSAEILAWLQKLSEPQASESDRQMVSKFLTEMGLEIIKAQPSVLLGQSQLQAYRDSLPAPRETSGQWPPDQAWLGPALSHVLSLRISIADKQAVTDVLAESFGTSWSETCEALIQTLRADAVEIHLREEYLRQLTTMDADNRVGLLDFLRDGMFAELGVDYPQFRIVTDEQLAANEFMFKVNHLTCLRQVGLGPEELLVNDTPEGLKAVDVPANAAGNPANGQTQSVTRLEHKRNLDSNGYTTWDQMGYLILSLANVLRRKAAVFVDLSSVNRQLEQLDNVFPALVQAARAAVSTEQIAAVLRGLVAEELSIRNLRLILERLCDYTKRNDPGWRFLLDGQSGEAVNARPGRNLTQLTEFVRAGMKREISGKFSKETNTLVTYLLDQGIEELLAASASAETDTKLGSGMGREQQEEIVESIRHEIAHLPPTAQVPLLLTSSDARVALRRAIAQDFPRMQVVAHQELLPDLNVQPVARISWGAGNATAM